MILILTNKADVHPNPVIEKLGASKFLRINTEDFLTDFEIKWINSSRKISWEIFSRKNSISVHSDEIISVWERRPEPIKNLKTSFGDQRKISKFCRDEATAFIRFFRYSLNDVFWIGNPIVDRLAQSRLLQQKVATSLGVLCTNSIFTNSAEEARRFAKKYNYICIKPINQDSISIDNYYINLGLTRKSSSVIENLSNESLESTIHYLQEYVDKDYEVRITVVCDDIFSCKLLSQEMPENLGKIDWREGLFNGLKHEITEVPDYIVDFCRAYLKIMNQNFGAFDFIVKPNGDFVFLECNSNGQWYWIELETGLDISGSIARHLITGG